MHCLFKQRFDLDLEKTKKHLSKLWEVQPGRRLPDGGWQSFDFHIKNLVPEPILQTISKVSKSTFDVHNINLNNIDFFANLNPGIKEPTVWHDHPEAMPDGISGVFYVDVGLGGELEFETIKIKPKNGLLCIFKPDMKHRILPTETNMMRLSIAFNYGGDCYEDRNI